MDEDSINDQVGAMSYMLQQWAKSKLPEELVTQTGTGYKVSSFAKEYIIPNEAIPPEPKPLEGSVLTRLCHSLAGDGKEPELWFVKIDGECSMVTDHAVRAVEYYRDTVASMEETDPFNDGPASSVELLCRACGSVVTAGFSKGDVVQNVHNDTAYADCVSPILTPKKK